MIPCHTTALACLAAGFLGTAAAPAGAQASFVSIVYAGAFHATVTPDESFADQAALDRAEAFAFGRLVVRADSDNQPQVYNANAYAWSQVDAAGIRLYATSKSVRGNGPSSANASARASGSLTDVFGLNVPGAALGSVFTVTAMVRMEGLSTLSTLPTWNSVTPENSANARTDWRSWIGVSQAGGSGYLAQAQMSQYCLSQNGSANPPGCSSDGAIGESMLTFQIINGGAPVNLNMTAEIVADTGVSLPAGGLAVADALMDLSHTVAWGGVALLRDAGGATVTDFSMFSSATGFDYRHAYVTAVPEPSSAALWLFGLAAMGGWLARRRSVC